MSVVSSVDCPVCQGKRDMMEDYFYKLGGVFYHCHVCGYGNYFKEKKERRETYWTCNQKSTKRKFAKEVNVKEKHGLFFTGTVPFYPIGAEFDEYLVYPRSRKGELVWKLYSPEKQLLGVFNSLSEAFKAGDEYADGTSDKDIKPRRKK